MKTKLNQYVKKLLEIDMKWIIGIVVIGFVLIFGSYKYIVNKYALPQEDECLGIGV